MKTAVCYCSRHQGNTLKVLEAMAREGDVELIDVTARQAVHLEEYGRIGLASGVYYGKFHPSVLAFARQYLPKGRPVFFVCTYGASPGKSLDGITSIAREKGCPILGAFGCRGLDTFGPFRLVGGIAKGHPDEADLGQARAFYRTLGGRPG